MLFKVVDDWKQNLPPEDEAKLNDLLKNIAKYRTAYKSSKDVKIAQLWCALLEMRKENQALLRKISRIEYVFDGLAERMRKDEKDSDLLSSLEKF